MRTTIYYCDWDKKKESCELLKLAISRYLDREIESITVCRTEEQGKPYVRELPEIHFSISHSGGIWVCAVSSAEVGLDLQVRYAGDGEKLARRFFHPSEVCWLEIHGFDQFSRLWAYKESYVKYTGVGLKDGLDYFSVVDELPVAQREIPLREGFWMVLTGSKDMSYEIPLCYLE